MRMRSHCYVLQKVWWRERSPTPAPCVRDGLGVHALADTVTTVLWRSPRFLWDRPTLDPDGFPYTAPCLLFPRQRMSIRPLTHSPRASPFSAKLAPDWPRRPSSKSPGAAWVPLLWPAGGARYRVLVLLAFSSVPCAPPDAGASLDCASARLACCTAPCTRALAAALWPAEQSRRARGSCVDRLWRACGRVGQLCSPRVCVSVPLARAGHAADAPCNDL
jgi:hypothetical protein